jgi:hypothetical protein
MAGCSDEAIAAAESLSLPVASRRYTRYGAFDTSFVEREEGAGEEEEEEVRGGGVGGRRGGGGGGGGRRLLGFRGGR